MTTTTMSRSASAAGGPVPSVSSRWATWTRRHPRPAKAGWVLLLVVSLAVGGWSEVRLASEHATAGPTATHASVPAVTPIEAATGTIAFGGHGRLASTTVAAVRSDLAISLSRVPGVDAVGAPVLSADGSSAVVTVTIRAAGADALRRVVARVGARHPGLDVSITGSAVAAAAAA